MKLAYRRGLPALFTVALAAGVVGVGTPALAAGEAPTGTFALDSTAIWTGQTVTLTQSALADDDTEPALVSRVINWGDGTAAQTAEAGTTSWTHTYAAVGTRTVTVTLNDGTVEGPGTLTPAAVAVTTPPGTLGWQKSQIYTGVVVRNGVEVEFKNSATFAPTGLPTNSTETWVDWNDDEFTLLSEGASSTTVPHYFLSGTHTPKVQMENAKGKATARNASPLTVSIDRGRPTSALTYPASPNKASSWKAIRGTGRDTQSGTDIAQVVAFKYNSTGVFYYDFYSKKWVKAPADPNQDLPVTAGGLSKISSTGTWSVPITGLSKGWKLEAWYWVFDQVGNISVDKYATVSMTS